MTEIPQPIDGLLSDAAILTVTLFGDHDAIDQAISDELGRRGCRTHSVSVKTGWLASTTNAIVRLDTVAGASAIEGLTVDPGPGAHVVVICEEPLDPQDSERLRHLCEECSDVHEVSLLWHAPLAVPGDGDPPEMGASEMGATDHPVRHLALAAVDQIADQNHRSAEPSFSSRSVAV